MTGQWNVQQVLNCAAKQPKASDVLEAKMLSRALKTTFLRPRAAQNNMSEATRNIFEATRGGSCPILRKQLRPAGPWCHNTR